jgi:acyl-CoA reductase-like NAD-dependent aldehyde dehydrogenase
METKVLNARTRVERRADPPVYRQQVTKAINPATFDLIGSVPMTHEGQIPGFIGRARRAAAVWGATPHAERARALARLRDLIVERAPGLAETISAGMGKPLVESLCYDVAMVVEHLDDYIARAGEYLADRPVPLPEAMGRKRALVRWAPRGIVAVISPWNYPFELAMTPAVSALAAGNAVVLKPTSAAPLVGEAIEKLFADALPEWPGLAQVLHGPGKLGTALATADGVDFVVFTGSTAVGRRLQQDLAPLLRPALLELGGSDPMIVCEDANVERAARAAVYGRFTNNGQVCAAVKRVYVHTAVARPFIERVVAHAKALRLGPYQDPQSDVGPLANDRAIGTLRTLLHDALDKGARLETGGFPAIQAGFYWPPTVITNVDHSMRIMKEEAFGPVLPIQVVFDDHEAVELANDNEYGLDAYVFSRDLDRAGRIADQLHAGSVDINEVVVNYVIRDLPFGGIKQSGQNRYHGPMGLQQFCNCKSLVIDDGTRDTEPGWFPYGPEQLREARDRVAAMVAK